ncbi:hypothetical protein BDBG_05308 [Blastomyces gilchristii SLH14081]|uniref:Uncharacterized protein n=1 Tax=Blastomyces gilchristii (strain SLH14081) TaxID=559298 RepID=A0A179UNZ6_BLAGS|nr:uncharacterized protein BDBG_05308 [Blastomyces gilchristii SLH14081]OAT09553.1 hypothetical protein BDBG_05308 [Blastomyces gilchristii SLH14081]
MLQLRLHARPSQRPKFTMTCCFNSWEKALTNVFANVAACQTPPSATICHHLPPSATIIARSIEDGRMGLPSHSRIVFKNMTQYFALKPGARELPIASRSRVPRIVDCGFPVPSPFALPSMESVLETAVGKRRGG